MYCTCSNKNNYQVIGLCDVNKFIKQSGPFDGMPWTQITVPAISTIDCNNADIEAIQKIYVNVSITSTKIIDTPKSPSKNSEGLSLTGKKLLIDGFICEKIVYTSLTLTQNINTLSFNFPFCTFIVIDENADVFNDTYCIKYCIEDVFVNLIDCKTLFQNITLFLFAQKTSITCPSLQLPKNDCTITSVGPNPILNKLKNSIIINNNSNPSSEVAKIEFNSDVNHLMVTSTDVIANGTSSDTYFSFKLKDNTNENLINSSNIRSNENGNAFSNALNDANFDYGNILELTSLQPSKVSITNFLNNGEAYIPTSNIEYFRITAEGLKAYTPPPVVNKLPNVITTTNRVGGTIGPVVKIEFNKDTERLIVSSTGVIPDAGAGSDIYFSLSLKDSNNSNIKNSSNILSNESAENFKSILNNQQFQYNDILEIYYETPNLATITNFPSQGNNYNPTKKTEFYKITPTGLVAYTPTPTVADLTNTIVVRSRRGIMSTIKFDADNKQLVVTATQAIALQDIKDITYFSFKLKDNSNRTIKVSSTILTDKTSERFKTTLNGQGFEFNDILELDYLDASQIIITDYPRKGTRHIPTINKEFYRITPTGLAAYVPPGPSSTSLTLPNEIIINTSLSKETSRILFDVTNNVFQIKSIYKTPYVKAGTQAYITVKLRAENTTIPKKIVSFLSNSNGEDFFNSLNNSSFTIGDFLEIYYFIPRVMRITNYVNKGETYTPTSQTEYYKITAIGLVPYTPAPPIIPPIVATLPNTIKIKASNGNNVATIQFDSGNKRFIASSTTEVPNYNEGIKEYFIIKLRNGTNKKVKAYSFITANSDGRNLASDLNKLSFEFGDILDFYYINPNTIEISAIPTKGQTHIPTNNKESYKITTNGLESFTDPLNIPISTIIINSKSNEEVATIDFGSNNKFIATVTGNIPDNNPSAANKEYFAFLSQKNSGLINFTSKFNSGEIADTFTGEINDKVFSDIDYISLSYDDKAKIQITNFKEQTSYTPNEYRNQFLIDNRPIINNSFRLINSILVVGVNDNVIATIQFNTLTKKIIALSTNKVAAQQELWHVALVDAFGSVVKTFSIRENKNGDDFANEFNGLDFEYGYFIVISIFNNKQSSLTITNFEDKIVNDLPPLFSDINQYRFIITSNGIIRSN